MIGVLSMVVVGLLIIWQLFIIKPIFFGDFLIILAPTFYDRCAFHNPLFSRPRIFVIASS